jgi:CheY-like chemotaxis protein
MSDTTRRVVMAVIPELLFATRVAEAARASGIEYRSAPLAALAERCRERRPDLVLVDLTAAGDPAAAIAGLRATPDLDDLPIVGFYPHVHDHLRVTALAAGATHVLPRSAFTAKLPEVLAGTFPAPR